MYATAAAGGGILPSLRGGDSTGALRGARGVDAAGDCDDVPAIGCTIAEKIVVFLSHHYCFLSVAHGRTRCREEFSASQRSNSSKEFRFRRHMGSTDAGVSRGSAG